jgi:glycosyltransferase involved in cell wall biosynthesis
VSPATESHGANLSERYGTSEGAASSERISAVIACYRDALAIPIMHERLTAVFTELGVDYEIIFVNDGSPDDSREVLLDGDLQDPPELIAAVDRLRPGTLMLTQPDEFDAPVKRAGKRPLPSGGKLVRLEGLALDRIRARFRLQEVDQSPSGLVLMRLVPRA